jgi:hypothetical protein
MVLVISVACDDEETKRPVETSPDMGGEVSDMDPDTPQSGDVNITSPEVRSCDVIFNSDRRSLRGLVTFSDQVRGVLRERLPQTAISFVARANQSIVGEVISFNLSEDEREAIVIQRSVCYDASGRAVEGEPITLN